ncbi:MAG TPA: hypothetical protein VEG38_03370 [Acidimicrobiia bacterium]|nr:hypothetical protein [Acidimicrobiia bacterium]
MGSRRSWSAVLGIALAVGLAVPLAMASPSGAATETTFDDTCADVYGKRPVGDLDKSTDPVAGSSVPSGQTVSITLQWPNSMVAGNRTHRVLECLSVDGGEPRQWAERMFTTDQGAASLSVVVPSDVEPKSTVCGQSFLKTEGPFGPVTRRSEKTCFPIGAGGTFKALARSPSPPSESRPEPESRSTPTTRGSLFRSPPSTASRPAPAPRSSSSDYQAPWPPWEEAPNVAAPPITTPTTTRAAAVTTTTRKAQAAQTAAPSPGATRAPSQTLPRTGAGLVVLLAIAAVALFSGRTLRKTAHHIEDNLPVEAVPVGDDDEPTLVLGRRW